MSLLEDLGRELLSLRATFKGAIGETVISTGLKLILDSSIYHCINNVTLPTPDGSTQIDHIIVSKYGLFVVELKTMKGWIFGDAKEPVWTQVIYGNKHKFQNPLRQNYKHTKTLSDLLQISHDKIHSVILFADGAELKTSMPENVLIEGLTHYITSKQTVLFTSEETRRIVEGIANNRLPETWKTRNDHINGIKQRVSDDKTCPKCKGELVLRTAKSGPNAGSQFYGCSNFPRCRYTRKAD